MVNGFYLYSAFILSALQLPHIHPFKVTTNMSGAVKVRRLAQGHLARRSLGIEPATVRGWFRVDPGAQKEEEAFVQSSSPEGDLMETQESFATTEYAT